MKSLFDRLADANAREVDKRFPDRLTNDGWATGNDWFCTKVYSKGDKPTMILCTYMDKGKIRHRVEKYWRHF